MVTADYTTRSTGGSLICSATNSWTGSVTTLGSTVSLRSSIPATQSRPATCGATSSHPPIATQSDTSLTSPTPTAQSTTPHTASSTTPHTPTPPSKTQVGTTRQSESTSSHSPPSSSSPHESTQSSATPQHSTATASPAASAQLIWLQVPSDVIATPVRPKVGAWGGATAEAFAEALHFNPVPSMSYMSQSFAVFPRSTSAALSTSKGATSGSTAMVSLVP